ncbi:GNAT family N-acetyltransferase [Microbacterium sp. NPDC058345]|uniref:GNAT family N-acetyltransferase n=1 Tax=Microbacterium sp. NPDC058345 TaxID=3346455 RepID=UPI003649EB23
MGCVHVPPAPTYRNRLQSGCQLDPRPRRPLPIHGAPTALAYGRRAAIRDGRCWIYGWTLVEEESDEALGHFDLTIDGEVARIGRVCIDPTRRGQGLAHLLVGFAIDRARSLGASELRLKVNVGNDAAIRTYERAGFTTGPRSDRPDVRVMTRAL